MTIDAFDHYTLRCANFQKSWHFYEDILGLRLTRRPGPGSPAAIVHLDEMMPIHLFQAGSDLDAIFARLKATDTDAAPWGTGRLHHIAFRAHGLGAMRKRLTDHKIAFTERTVPSTSKHLVLFKDPDNVEIELSFTLQELESTHSA